MLCRDDLRERLRLSAIGFVTAGAQHGRVGERGHHGSWIFDVPRQWTVTAFATQAGMLAFAFYLSLIGVTGLASLAAGELNRLGPDLVQGPGPEVPVFTEIGRNDGPPDNQEGDHPQPEQDDYTD